MKILSAFTSLSWWSNAKTIEWSPLLYSLFVLEYVTSFLASYVYFSLLFHYHCTVPTVTQWFSATDLYYGGEALTAEQPQSFTCPYCGKMGYTDATLHEHVTAEHGEASTEVVSISRCIHTYSNIKLQGCRQIVRQCSLSLHVRHVKSC